MNILLLVAASPFWLGHFVYRRLFLFHREWTLQNSLDFVWEGDPFRSECRRCLNRAERRANWPKDLRDADIYLEYMRTVEAKEILSDYLTNHPGDHLALSLMEKAAVLERKRK